MRNAGELGFALALREERASAPPSRELLSWPRRESGSRRRAPLEEERESEDLASPARSRRDRGFSESRPPLLPCLAGSCPELALALSAGCVASLPVLALLRGASAGESPAAWPLPLLFFCRGAGLPG